MSVKRAHVGALVAAMAVLLPARASADWQLKPFLGGVFAGKTTFFDLDNAAGNRHLIIGGNAVYIGELVGLEADLGRTPSFFRSGDRHLVLGGSVSTLTGNVVIAMPRHMTQYSLRPYVVGGGGVMHARVQDSLEALRVSSTLGTVDLGGGATGFLTDRFGVDWQLRYFRSVGGSQRGQSFGDEQLSFWRATMALAFRY